MLFTKVWLGSTIHQQSNKYFLFAENRHRSCSLQAWPWFDQRQWSPIGQHRTQGSPVQTPRANLVVGQGKLSLPIPPAQELRLIRHLIIQSVDYSDDKLLIPNMINRDITSFHLTAPESSQPHHPFEGSRN